MASGLSDLTTLYGNGDSRSRPCAGVRIESMTSRNRSSLVAIVRACAPLGLSKTLRSRTDRFLLPVAARDKCRPSGPSIG